LSISSSEPCIPDDDDDICTNTLPLTFLAV
jgi:hypothetical protein